jgi:Trypsin
MTMRAGGTTAPAIRAPRWPQSTAVLLVVVAGAVWLAGLFPAGPAHAIQDAADALGSVGQVRIFRDGARQVSGTLVARNWALTVDHGALQNGDPAYLIFGAVNDANDADPTHRRTIDAIERHENRADLALVHFADPVPEGTFIPDIATAAPSTGDPAHAYGWNGGILGRVTTTILDPADVDIFQRLRSGAPAGSQMFSEGYPPMTMNSQLDRGDSGGGTFAPWNVLTGIHVADLTRRTRTQHGTNYSLTATLDQPLWLYRNWILSVTTGPPPGGATPPSGNPPSGNPTPTGPQRQLLDATTGSGATTDGILQMTLPPQTDHCDPGMPSCTVTNPVWARGRLLGAGNYRGTALARCASAGTNSCSFDGAAYGNGASARMRLGPLSAPGSPGTREVMIWCRSSVAFPDANSPVQQVLRVSFTNADPRDAALAYGWWDVTPDQVDSGQGPVDAGTLATC